MTGHVCLLLFFAESLFNSGLLFLANSFESEQNKPKLVS